MAAKGKAKGKGKAPSAAAADADATATATATATTAAKETDLEDETPPPIKRTALEDADAIVADAALTDAQKLDAMRALLLDRDAAHDARAKKLRTRESRALAAAGVVAVERDAARDELGKALHLKDKLEALCRELQKTNKAVVDGAKIAAEEESKRREELSAKFEGGLTDIRCVHSTLVPIRPRRRDERHSLRTFAGVSLRPGSLAFNPRLRYLSTHPDAFQLHPDVALYEMALSAKLEAHGAERDAQTKENATLRGHLESLMQRAEAQQARPGSHWFPYDRVRVVKAVSLGPLPSFLSAHPALLSIPTRRDAFRLRRLTPFIDSAPTSLASYILWNGPQKHFEKAKEAFELEKRLYEARLEESNERLRAMEAHAEELRGTCVAAGKREKEALAQLVEYGERFATFQDTIKQSSETFESFRVDIKDLRKRLEKSEKEKREMEVKTAKSDVVLIETTQEREEWRRHAEAYKLKAGKLEALCRTLSKRAGAEEEGGGLAADGKENDAVNA